MRKLDLFGSEFVVPQWDEWHDFLERVYRNDTCAIYACAVVFAAPQVALAVSLNLRTYLRLKATNTGKVCVNLPNIDRFLCWDVSELKRVMPFCSGNYRCSAQQAKVYFS